MGSAVKKPVNQGPYRTYDTLISMERIRKDKHLLVLTKIIGFSPQKKFKYKLTEYHEFTHMLKEYEYY